MLPRLLLLFTVVIWGWSFVASKICLGYMEPFELMGLRFLIALPVLYVIIIFKKSKLQIRRNLGRLIPGSLIITIHFFIQITGIKYTSATNTGWIIAVTPLVMALLAWLILKEYLNFKTISGIAVATIGIIFLISNGRINDLGWLSSYGDWLILASAHQPPAIFAFAVMHGGAWGLRGPMMQAIRADYFGRRAFGSIMGASSLLVMLGTITGPLVAGYIDLLDMFPTDLCG